MGESYGQVGVDGAGKKLRSRQRVIGANTDEEMYLIRQRSRIFDKTNALGDGTDRYLKGSFETATFLIPGNGGTQDLFAMGMLLAGQDTQIALRRLTVALHATALLATVTPQVQLIKIQPSNITAGTALTRMNLDSTGLASNTNIVCKGTNAADFGATTSLAVGTLLGTAYQTFVDRPITMGTTAGTSGMQIASRDMPLLPPCCDNDTPFLLSYGNGITVRVVGTNPSTNTWVVNAMWEEWGKT